MFVAKSAENAAIETQKKPFIVCGFLGVFWNIYSEVRQSVKALSEEKVPPVANIVHFCDRNTCTTVGASAAEKKELLEKFERLRAEGSRGASRKIHYGPEDHLGSTRMVLAQDGTVKEALMYQPYGTIAPVSGIPGTGNDPLRDKFTTKEFDEDGQLNVGLIEFNIALDFALTHSDPAKPNRVAVYYTDAPTEPDIVNITIDPATDKGKLNAVIKNAASRTVASIQFKLNDDAVTCNVENIAEITNPGAKLIIEQAFTDVSVFLATVPKTFLNYSNASFYMAGIRAYHFGFRVYDPEIGVWMSTDPKDQLFNPYGYSTSPIMTIDPDGQYIAGAIIGGLIGAYAMGALENGSLNPGKWDWDNAGTYTSIASGAMMGASLGSGIENGILQSRFDAGKISSTYGAKGVIRANGGPGAIKQRYLEHHWKYYDRATDWDQNNLTDMWLEGPAGDEPNGHMSFNVGDPLGSYKSYSFGVNGEYNWENWMEGEIYSDATPGGQIIEGSYLKTTAEQDRLMQAAMDAKIGIKAPYLPNSTCRSWSRTFWNTANDMYGPAVDVPFEQIVPAGKLNVPVPFSSTVR